MELLEEHQIDFIVSGTERTNKTQLCHVDTDLGYVLMMENLDHAPVTYLYEHSSRYCDLQCDVVGSGWDRHALAWATSNDTFKSEFFEMLKNQSSG